MIMEKVKKAACRHCVGPVHVTYTSSLEGGREVNKPLNSDIDAWLRA
jgi:hypothetical protein